MPKLVDLGGGERDYFRLTDGSKTPASLDFTKPSNSQYAILL